VNWTLFKGTAKYMMLPLVVLFWQSRFLRIERVIAGFVNFKQPWKERSNEFSRCWQKMCKTFKANEPLKCVFCYHVSVIHEVWQQYSACFKADIMVLIAFAWQHFCAIIQEPSDTSADVTYPVTLSSAIAVAFSLRFRRRLLGEKICAELLMLQWLELT